jgi:hypothetical protein
VGKTHVCPVSAFPDLSFVHQNNAYVFKVQALPPLQLPNSPTDCATCATRMENKTKPKTKTQPTKQTHKELVNTQNTPQQQLNKKNTAHPTTNQHINTENST